MTKIHDDQTGLDLTAPQDLALRLLRKKGEISVAEVRTLGLDHRALRALTRLAPALVTLVATTAYHFTAPTPVVEAEGGASEATDGDDGLPFAAAPAKGTKAAKVAKVGEDCLCGCAGKAKPGSKFICGHDSKLHAVIRKIDRGEGGLELLPPGDRVLEWLRTSPWRQAHPKFAEILASATLPKEDAAPSADEATPAASDAPTGEDAAPPAETAETAATASDGATA